MGNYIQVPPFHFLFLADWFLELRAKFANLKVFTEFKKRSFDERKNEAIIKLFQTQFRIIGNRGKGIGPVFEVLGFLSYIMKQPTLAYLSLV